LANAKDLIISIGGKLNGSLKAATSSAKSELTGLQKASGLLKGAIIGALGAVSIAGIVSKGKECIAIAESGEKTTAQLKAVLESTNGVSGMTVDSATKLAASLSSVTTYSKGTIKGAENMLLTFTGIKSDVFPGATEAALNMATALKTDATSAAQTLGKALNDPAKGITKLTKNGVVFTEEQKKQINAMVKAGDTAGAQKLMLKELETEYGNSARAAANTTEGRKQQIQNSITSIKSAVGSRLLPIVASITSSVASHLPEISDLVNNLMDKLQPAVDFIKAKIVPAVVASMPIIIDVIGKVVEIIGKAFQVIKKVIDFVKQHKSLFQDIATIILAVVSAILVVKAVMMALWGVFNLFRVGLIAMNAIAAVNPFVWIVIAIVAVVLLWRHCTAFRNALKAIGSGIKIGISAVASFFVAVGKGAVTVVMAIISGFKAFFTAVFNGIKAVFTVVVTIFLAIWSSAIAGVKAVISGLQAFFSAVFNGIKTVVSGVASFFGSVFDGVISGIKTAWSSVGTFFSDLWNGIKSAFDKVFGGILNTISTIASKIKGLFGDSGGGTNISVSARGPRMMATGGIVKHRPGGIHAIIGEGKDDEAVVPLKKGGFGGGNVTFAPVQNFYGDVNKADVEAANAASFEQFKRWMKQYDADKKRRAFA